MRTPDEHEDDLEPEVTDGAEIETEEYPAEEGNDPSPDKTDLTSRLGGAGEKGTSSTDVAEDPEDDASDTI
jgi:hypothetical protein